jgi:serine/threonine protein kinase
MRPVVAMPFPIGGLLEILEKRPELLTATLRVKVVVSVLQALSYLHSRGIVHGHVNPSRIFSDSSMRPGLCCLDVGDLSYRWEFESNRCLDEYVQRGGSRWRGEMNSDMSSISLKMTMAAYGDSICDDEKESESEP